MSEIAWMNHPVLSHHPCVSEVIDHLLHLVVADIIIESGQVHVELLPLFECNASIGTWKVARQQLTQFR